MTIAEIRSAAEKYRDDYECVAIRTQSKPFKCGKVRHRSAVWNGDDMTSGKLRGICATEISSSALSMHSDEWHFSTGRYVGDYLAIVCGNDYVSGNDPGEVIITNAVVVEILK